MNEWSRGDPAKAPPRAPLAIGGPLDATTLLQAYRAGIFPWYSEGEPVRWWSPDPRFVLLPEELRVTESLRRSMRKPGWSISFDRDFEAVMRACAEVPRPGQDGTWITPEMRAAYCDLHGSGRAHSVEVRRAGQLIGGLYGVLMGTMFFGESMFSTATDATPKLM